jgi:UDP-glucose-4-epimerase GalE
MRILVTGGAGYVGSHAVRLFLARGHDVTVYDNLSAGHRAAVGTDRLIVGDLADLHQLDQLLITRRIEAVVHFAALTSVAESVRQPARYYRNNVILTLQLLECLQRQRIERFVFSSSAATYGVPRRIPIVEDDPQVPINPYGNSKLAVERALGDYAAGCNWGCAALRYFNAAGAAGDGSIGEDHDPETHLIPIILQAQLGRRPDVEVFGTDYPTPDGTCIRDYVHVDDLAEAHMLVLERLRPGQLLCYNVGIGRGYSVREVIRCAEELTGKPVPVKAAPRRPGDPPSLVASPARIQADLGWTPRYTDLRPIMETAWNWHRSHPRGFKGR